MLVPLTINYVSPSSYGVWLAMSSIVTWITFFDIGINNGLRNKLARSLAKFDFEESQHLISTTYAILSFIFIPLLIILVIVNSFLNWPSILHTPNTMHRELYLVSLILFSFFCINFILSTINVVLLSNQRPAEAALRSVIEQLFSLAIIFTLTKTTHGSLLNLAIGLCIAPLTVLLYFNFTLFKGRYKNIAPKFSKIDFSLGKGLFSLGLKFFVIQIAGIIQFQTANIILIRSFGANEVTSYNICFKYFSILSMGMSILIAPLWSSVTDAYAKNDFLWIINTVNRYTKIGLIFLVLGIVMFIFSQNIFKVWIHNQNVVISYPLCFWMLLFSLTSVFGGIFCGVLNGIGELRLQFLASLISPIIFLAMCYVLINFFHFGISSIVIAIIISNFNGYLLGPLQYRTIFFGKKSTVR
jgi:O-antigen/teichoic acid export membrane protein